METGRRYLTLQAQADLKRKMVFIAGPCQVGKTTMARAMLKNPDGYLSWNIRAHRDQILREEWPDVSLIVLDEIHQFRKWRNLQKGLFDQYRREMQILVTGARSSINSEYDRIEVKESDPICGYPLFIGVGSQTNGCPIFSPEPKWSHRFC